MSDHSLTPVALPQLTQEIVSLVHTAKQRPAVAVNAELTLLYWSVVQRIRQEILKGERAEYGQHIIGNLSKALTAQLGRGWRKSQLNYYVKFAEVFDDINIVHAVRGQLSWTHLKTLMYIDDHIKREFYLSMAVQERWSTRTLDERIGSMLFERTAISKKPDETILHELQQLKEQGVVHQQLLLKDPYILDFLVLS